MPNTPAGLLASTLTIHPFCRAVEQDSAEDHRICAQADAVVVAFVRLLLGPCALVSIKDILVILTQGRSGTSYMEGDLNQTHFGASSLVSFAKVQDGRAADDSERVVLHPSSPVRS